MIDLWRQWLWPTIGLAVVNGWWVAATFDGARPRAVAAGTAALVVASLVPTTVESLIAAVALLGVMPLAAVTPGLLGPALVVVAAVALAASRKPDRLIALAGAALIAASLVVTAVDGFGWDLRPSSRLAAALAVAGGLILLAGRNPALLGPGLLAAATAAPALGDAQTALPAGAAAIALAVLGRPAPAIAAVGLAAVPLAPAPAFLLLAGGALAAAVPWRPAVLAAVPGAVALAAALAAEPLTLAGAATAAALAATAGLVAHRPAAGDEPNPKPQHAPALVLLAGLVALPTLWRWAGPGLHDLLDPYQLGLAVAAAAAGIAAVATSLFRLRDADRTTTP